MRGQHPEPLEERGVCEGRSWKDEGGNTFASSFILHPSAFVLHRVSREALESSSAVLQTAAMPSQLPTRFVASLWIPVSCCPTKKARCRVTPGFSFSYEMVGQMSQAQGARQRIHRIIGKSSRTALFAYETGPENHHRAYSRTVCCLLNC